jgi:LacI family transcriptional regulator
MPQSLPAQTVGILKEKILSGEWGQTLPSERELSDWLVVSRGTLRAALARLQREGFVKSRQGRPWEIVDQKKIAGPRPATKRLALLTASSLSQLGGFEMFWIDNLRRHLQDAGYQLEVCQEAARRGARSVAVLDELNRKLRPDGWVLQSTPAAVQRWFSERRLPCVIVGSRHEGVKLPSVDRDLPAACRHAAGLLAARGHTRLVLVIPKSGLAGDLACEKSFLEAARPLVSPRDGEVLIAHHDNRAESIFRRLNLLLQRRPAPTGFLITGTKSTLAVLSFLLRKGRRVPQEAALISRDSDPFLDYFTPSVARYTSDSMIFARKVSRLVLELVHGGPIRAMDYRVTPKFVPGETLG